MPNWAFSHSGYSLLVIRYRLLVIGGLVLVFVTYE